MPLSSRRLFPSSKDGIVGVSESPFVALPRSLDVDRDLPPRVATVLSQAPTLLLMNRPLMRLAVREQVARRSAAPMQVALNYLTRNIAFIVGWNVQM